MRAGVGGAWKCLKHLLPLSDQLYRGSNTPVNRLGGIKPRPAAQLLWRLDRFEATGIGGDQCEKRRLMRQLSKMHSMLRNQKTRIYYPDFDSTEVNKDPQLN